MKKNKFLVIAATAALLVSCGGGGSMNFDDNEYPVQTVGTQSAASQTTYPATIKGIQDVEIRPKASGFITRVCVQEGQNVSAGQLLFVIDNETYQAAVNTASAQLNTAKLTYDNSQQLHKNNVIGDYELQSAKNTYESAEAQVNQAKAALAQAQAGLASARENLSFCYVKSPATGVVGNLPYKVGALVSASSPQALTTVSNISTMEVYFSMSEKDMLEMTKASGGANAAVQSMPAVKLQLADGSIYNHEGRVTKVSGIIDQNTGSVSMIAQFPNPERLLKSGGSGSIVVPHSNANAIVVPQSCVMEVQDKHFVYVLKDSIVNYTEITVEPQNDGRNYVVVSGLSVGDKYVTNGITKLQDKMVIKPITPEQYEKKMKEAEGLGAAQGDASKLKEVFSK